MLGHAVVRVWTVEILEEETLLPVALVQRAREEDAHVVRVVVAVAHPSMPGLEVAQGARDLRPAHLLGAARNHVDHREEGTGAIERRAGTSDDLETFDQRDIEGKLAADESAAKHVVVQPMAVDEQEDARVVVARTREAADADVAVVPV